MRGGGSQKCEGCHGKDGAGGSSAMLINPSGKNDRNMANLCANRHHDLRLHTARDAVYAAEVTHR
jgi:hypothetical protein